SALPWPRGRSRCRPTAKESRHRALRRKEWRRWRSSLLRLEMEEAAQERRALELDLREALISDQFQLYFQPLVDLRTGRVTTCEALMRWKHPNRGMVQLRQSRRPAQRSSGYCLLRGLPLFLLIMASLYAAWIATGGAVRFLGERRSYLRLLIPGAARLVINPG